MGKVMNNASYLIKTREYYIGFPREFSFYPENMDAKRRSRIHEQAIEAMQNPADISKTGPGVRRVVIGDGKYLVLGVCGYLNVIMKDLADEYHLFCDLSETRRSYGFVGFVWDLETANAVPARFPDVEEFSKVLKKEIVPHWKDSGNSVWAEKQQKGIPIPYDYQVTLEDNENRDAAKKCQLNTDSRKIAISSFCEENGLIREAIRLAVSKKEVSLCTDLEIDKGNGSGFMNVTVFRNIYAPVTIDNSKKSTPFEYHESEVHQYRDVIWKFYTRRYTQRKAIENLEYFVEKVAKRYGLEVLDRYYRMDSVTFILRFPVRFSIKEFENVIRNRIFNLQKERKLLVVREVEFWEISQTGDEISQEVQWEKVSDGSENILEEAEKLQKRLEELYGTRQRPEENDIKPGNPFEL